MLADDCFDLLKTFSHQTEKVRNDEVPLYLKMKELIELEKELLFILPAFPAKSPSPGKTSGIGPDMAEVIALRELNDLCANLSALYAPGARILICSDGRVFSDIVGVEDTHVDHYSLGIEAIIRDFKLSFLSTLSMDDIYPDLKGHDLRMKLMATYGKSIEEVKSLVSTDENYRSLFNGIHKFLIEDHKDLHPHKTKSQIHRETKARTYELLRRSDAWSALLNHFYKDELRLSIHPYPLHHEKFGIRMVRSSQKWATPWHNVLVKIENHFELMHLKEALNLKASLKMYKDKYVYFEA